MLNERVNYASLQLEYLDPNSLVYKKLRIIDKYINKSHSLLDIGAGTGELIKLEKQKFEMIYGIDVDGESAEACTELFKKDEHIRILHGSIDILESSLANIKFEYITCLDVLEHIEMNRCGEYLKKIYKLLEDDGIFLFSGPGIFEKIRIFMGRSPTHLHSHSSYGWKKMIQEAGFNILSIETVEFPMIHSDFLRKNVHIFGKCCLIVSKKVSSSEKCE
ncbi:MAG: class I SAM-dependent methyltransferase [Candidatus Methanoperedens sp.]|nr:class I SAM-dependent methyltransferase [Candidatus Methanoperedens sp.]